MKRGYTKIELLIVILFFTGIIGALSGIYAAFHFIVKFW